MEFFGMPLGKWIVEIIGGVIAAIAAVVGWLFRRDQENKKKFEQLMAEMVAMKKADAKEKYELKTRITVLETTVENMPGRASVARVYERLNEQSKSLHNLEGKIQGLNDTNQLILAALLERGKENK